MRELLVKEGAIASPQIEERPKQGVSGQFVEHLLLDRLDSITAMASIDGNYCADLVVRWDNLESGRAIPTAHLKEDVQAEEAKPPHPRFCWK
ncbi:hypothetical protein ACTL6P_22990 [Endozoicomonas acroporae]|uniref:hypothetical protein n=1 Tax=Endozoicomonas acroporae TaxID=1701104 RepID=UPI000C7817E1|nr:hypothetical protein [Endozoicomonas acroporae]